jgi:hypothetical protein
LSKRGRGQRAEGREIEGRRQRGVVTLSLSKREGRDIEFRVQNEKED